MSPANGGFAISTSPQTLEPTEAFVVRVAPILLARHLVPTVEVERVQVQHVALPVACDQIQRPRHAHALFVKVNRKHTLFNVVLATRRLALHREQMARIKPLVRKDVAPDLEHAMHGETGRASRRVNQEFIFFRVEHLHAHINHITRREILPLLALRRFVD